MDPSVCRVALLWDDSNSTQTAVNVIHILNGAASTDDVAAALNANVTASMFETMSNQWQCISGDFQFLDGVSSKKTIALDGTKFIGGTAGDYIPQSATLVKLQTGKRGRSKRGRIFLPAVAEGAQSNGVLNGAKVASMQTGWDAFAGNMVVDGFHLVVESYKLASHENVTALLVELETGTQRRRQSRNR